MEEAFRLTLDYLKTRQQFGSPIGRFQALQHRFSDLLIELEQVRSAVINAAGHLGDDPHSRDRHIAAARNLIGRAGRLVAEEAIQMHGAAGVSQWTPLAGLYTGQRTLRLADGPDEVHHMVVGRAETRKYTGEEEDPAMAAVWRK